MKPRLALAIPTLNRAPMLDAILRDVLPEALASGVAVCVSDNGSSDDTPAVCARWAARHPEVRFRRHPVTLPVAESLMSVVAMSPAEHTWLRGDDDALVPGALARVLAVLDEGREISAIVTGTAEIEETTVVDYDQPLFPQLARFAGAKSGRREHADAAAFFADKLYDLPVPSVVYRTAAMLATNYQRYYPTHHAHIGALFDALAAEEERRGRIDIVELTDTFSVSLTSLAMRPKGKDGWTALFMDLAHHGFPLWFDLLPAIYAPHLEAGRAHHRHIFRAAFADDPSGKTA